MATLSDLVQETRNLLRSFTGVQEEVVALSGGIDDTTLTLTTSDDGRIRRGIIEIDDELIYVDGHGSGVVTLPFSRGFRGSTAATHSDGALVTIDPLFPAKNVKDALIETQAALFPNLYQVKSATITKTTDWGYELPADCSRVLRVSSDSFYGDGIWEQVRRWDFVPNSDPTEFPSGKVIEIYGHIDNGRDIRVVYVADFTPFASASDTLAGAGHAESHRDVLIYGAAWRLIQFVEASRLQLGAVEQQARSQYSQNGSATAMARQVYALFNSRLQEERSKLLRLTPTIVRKTR